jgi:hypothetical protein
MSFIARVERVFELFREPPEKLEELEAAREITQKLERRTIQLRFCVVRVVKKEVKVTSRACEGRTHKKNDPTAVHTVISH